MINSVETLPQAMALIQDFLIERTAATPADVRATLREVIDPSQPTPVATRKAIEVIYARRAELPVELLQIGVQMTNLMVRYQQLGYQNGRGQGILAELLSIPGVQPTEAVPTEPPAPDPNFTPETETDGADTPAITAPPLPPEEPKVVPPSPV